MSFRSSAAHSPLRLVGGWVGAIKSERRGGQKVFDRKLGHLCLHRSRSPTSGLLPRNIDIHGHLGEANLENYLILLIYNSVAVNYHSTNSSCFVAPNRVAVMLQAFFSL